MEPLMQPLMVKIKTLNETIWEARVPEPSIREWLDNFSPSNSSDLDERLHALFLLSNFMYFGIREIRELLKALYRDLYRYSIVNTIRRSNGDTLDSVFIDSRFQRELAVTRFLGVGSPSESGNHLLYYFRQENNLSSNLFMYRDQIFTRGGGPKQPQLRYPAVTRYIFIDDFCGSGKQGTEYSRDIVEDIKRLDPSAFVAYYVLFATTQGISKVRAETAFDEAKGIYELDTSFQCFSLNSRYFRTPSEGIDRNFCEQMCRKYGAILLADPHELGFEDSQLLIGFQHNTPDNTLPIIWYDGSGTVSWRPIFRRYPKA